MRGYLGGCHGRAHLSRGHTARHARASARRKRARRARTHGRFARIKFGSVGAVVASAGLFSAAHLPNLFAGGDPAYTLLQAAFAFCAGVSLGALSVCSGGILPSVILHTVINLSSVVTETAVKTARSIEAITLCGLAALYLAAGIFILHRQKKREETS